MASFQVIYQGFICIHDISSINSEVDCQNSRKTYVHIPTCHTSAIAVQYYHDYWSVEAHSRLNRSVGIPHHRCPVISCMHELQAKDHCLENAKREQKQRRFLDTKMILGTWNGFIYLKYLDKQLRTYRLFQSRTHLVLMPKI